MGRDVAYNNAVCAHDCVVSNRNGTHHLATRAEDDVIANTRHAFSSSIRFVDETHAGVDGAVIADDNTVGDHNAKAGVNVKPAANDCAWMNLRAGHAAYYEIGEPTQYTQ